MTTPESQPLLGSTRENAQRDLDKRVANAVAGCVFSSDLDMRAGTLEHVLQTARRMEENDPRRGVLAMYGEALLGIVAPEIQMPPTEGNQ